MSAAKADVPYVYIFVRRDLSPAQQIIQVGHVLYEAPQGSRGTHFVLIAADDESHLLDLVNDAHKSGVTMHLFYETDHGVGFSAAASEEIYGEKRQVFSHLQTYEP